MAIGAHVKLCFLAAALAGVAAAGEPAAPGVQACGVRVVAPGPEEEMRAFNWTPGVTVALLVNVPGGGVIDVEDDVSKLTVFRDDKGKDLLKSGGGEGVFERAGFGMMPQISKDGRLVLLEAQAPGCPTKGAAALRLSGEAVLRVASKTEEFAAQNVAIKPNTPIQAGPIPFTVFSVGKPDFGGEEYQLQVGLQARKEVSSVADIRFFDAAGKKLEVQRSMTSSTGDGVNATVQWLYLLKDKPDAVKVVITYWTDMRQVRIPFDLSVGLGL
jgi:hypothetical protein